MNDLKCKTAHFVDHMISVSVTICLLAFPTVKSHWSKNLLQVVTLNIIIFWLVDIVSRFVAVLCSGDCLSHCAWLGHTKMLFNIFHFHAQFTLLFKSLESISCFWKSLLLAKTAFILIKSTVKTVILWNNITIWKNYFLF